MYLNVIIQILLFYLSPAFLQAPVERLETQPHALGCYYQHQPEREREREVSWGKNTTPMIHRLQSSMAETELFSYWFGKAQPHCLFNQKSFSGYKQHNMNFSKSSLLCPKVNIFLVVAYFRHMTLLLVSRMFHIRTEVVITAL